MKPIILEFKEAVIRYFKDEEDFCLFLKEPTTAFDGKSPEDWLLHSRRSDRLDFAIDTVRQMKTLVGYIGDHN
jgi:hypothetical protein